MNAPFRAKTKHKQSPHVSAVSAKAPARHTHSRAWRIWHRVCLTLLVLIVLFTLVRISFVVSPWPGSLLIRYAFTKGSTKTSEALQKYVPDGIAEIANQQYRPHDSDAQLNVFYPKNTAGKLPTIVWVHGGGWVSGNKDNMNNYLQILAARGFTTVTVNYTIAPEKQYPTPIVQLNAALQYLQQQAPRLHIDPNQILLAGDSAGSQIAAQTADIITNPTYAMTIGIQPTLPASSLKGMLLNCGAYDLALPDYNGPFGGFLRTVLWAYSGTKNFLHDPKLQTASVANYLTPNFPPAFITAGNADPLLTQSTELASRLQGLHVVTSTLFYPADHQPALNHEYQFNLDSADGKQAFQQMVDFAQLHTSIIR